MRHNHLPQAYHGFTIEGQREYPTPGDFDRWFFRISRRGELQFGRSVRISRSQSAIMRLDDTKINEVLRDTGLRQIHGKIDLGHYVEDENEEFVITGNPPELSSLSDRDVRLSVLQVLEKIWRLNPTRHRLESFDTRGFCEVLNISYENYLANAVYLRERGYVADSRIEQLTIENGGIYITATGIDYLEQQPQQTVEAPVNTDAEVTRDRMLSILYEFEETGSSDYLLSTAIAEQMGLLNKEVRYHLEILAEDRYIRLLKTASNFGAKIDTQGIRRVREGYRHSPAVSVSGGPSIHITHSNVGLLNTGEIAEVKSIAVNISTLSQSGYREIAEALTAMTEAIANSNEITPEQQAFLLENLEELSTQAARDPARRAKPGVIKSLLTGITTTVATAGGLAEVWNTWGPAIMNFFEIA